MEKERRGLRIFWGGRTRPKMGENGGGGGGRGTTLGIEAGLGMGRD